MRINQLGKARRPHRYRPQLEVLENRTLFIGGYRGSAYG
jgi:hypothetical protein